MPDESNTDLKLGGVALDVTGWRYQLYRGAEPRPQIVPIGAQRAGDFAKLGIGPHVLEAVAPNGRGDPNTAPIQGVYLEYVEATNNETGLLRLYDVRWALQEVVCTLDLNMVRPSDADKAEVFEPSQKRYKADTAISETEPATLDYAIERLKLEAAGAGVVVKCQIDTGAGTRKLRDNMPMAGYLKLNEAFGEVAEAGGCDLTVGSDGVLYITDRANAAVPNVADSTWWLKPEYQTSTGNHLGAPRFIDVFVIERWELVLDLPASPGSSIAPRIAADGVPNLDLEQVFQVGNTFYTTAEFATFIQAFLDANAFTGGHGRYGKAQDLPGQIDRNIGSDQWLGTALQTVPYTGARNTAEGFAAAAAKGFVDIIRRDYRKLFRVVDRDTKRGGVKQVIDHWSDATFGVLDQYGQVTDYYEPAQGSQIGAVSGSWCELLQSPMKFNVMGYAALDGDIGINHLEPSGGEQVAPFTAAWEDAARWVIRLTPTSPLEASPVVGLVANRFPGVWRQVPQVRSVVAADLISTDANVGDLRVMQSAAKGELSGDPRARLRVVATRRSPNNYERFHIVRYPTGIAGATRTLEVTATPDIALAKRADGTRLNEARVKEDALIVATRIAEAYKAGAVGVGVAHGVGLLNTVKYPSGSLQSMTLMIGSGQYPEFIGVECVFGAAPEADRIRIARQDALQADREARVRKPERE